MHDLAGSYFRGFSTPADRTTWTWVAAFAIVAMIFALLMLASGHPPRVATNDPAAVERTVVPPITQPAPSADGQTQL